jgi:hypothetical protein
LRLSKGHQELLSVAGLAALKKTLARHRSQITNGLLYRPP